MWDPDVYLTFAGHRGRPFYDLLSQCRRRNRVGSSTWAAAQAT
jgi:trans-aconitate methyltransferase